MWAVVDASFCNRTVFGLLDPRIVLIGRVRKDICIYGPVKPNVNPEQVGRGRKASYGPLLPTPEQLRQDAATPWEKCPIFAAGKRHELNYKTIAPVFWRSGAGTRPMRLIVIRPLRYRAHGHTLYREPAYLLVDDPNVPKQNSALSVLSTMKFPNTHTLKGTNLSAPLCGAGQSHGFQPWLVTQFPPRNARPGM